jgi:hypothetical protein
VRLIAFLVSGFLALCAGLLYVATFVVAPIFAAKDCERAMRWGAIGTASPADAHWTQGRPRLTVAGLACHTSLLVAYAGAVLPVVPFSALARPGLGALAAALGLVGSLYSAHVAMHIASSSTSAPRLSLRLAAMKLVEGAGSFACCAAIGGFRDLELKALDVAIVAVVSVYPIACILQSVVLVASAKLSRADRVSRGVPWGLSVPMPWLIAAAVFMYVFSNFFLWGRALTPNLRPY